MSATGLDVFDKTIQTTNIWLNEIVRQIGPDERVAWKVLSVVLHKLRDRLPPELAAHLASQLPLLVRGVYYDQYEPSRLPTSADLDSFVDDVQDWLADTRPVDAKEAIAAVFAVLSHHIPHGQIENVQNALPKDIRGVWLSAEESVIPPPDQGEAGRYARAAQRT